MSPVSYSTRWTAALAAFGALAALTTACSTSDPSRNADVKKNIKLVDSTPPAGGQLDKATSVSYTHLTLPTNREV